MVFLIQQGVILGHGFRFSDSTRVMWKSPWPTLGWPRPVDLAATCSPALVRSTRPSSNRSPERSWRPQRRSAWTRSGAGGGLVRGKLKHLSCLCKQKIQKLKSFALLGCLKIRNNIHLNMSTSKQGDSGGFNHIEPKRANAQGFLGAGEGQRAKDALEGALVAPRSLEG